MADATTDVATLGGGCFWCTEAAFEDLRGVEMVEPGYAGGSLPNPTYEQVCTGETGHAEVVRVTFDPHVISYRALLEVFFVVHDPTTRNMQGADVGSQYRSVIFYRNEEQKSVAEEVMREIEASGVWGMPLVTEIVALERFYRAEGYHRRYFRNHAESAYCRAVIAPKVAKLRRRYASMMKATNDAPLAR